MYSLVNRFQQNNSFEMYFHILNNYLSSFFWSSRLVSGSGDIKLTKDGNVLLHEMVSTDHMISFFKREGKLKIGIKCQFSKLFEIQ